MFIFEGEVATAKAEQTRRQILAAALSLFARQGYAATTLRQIAGEAGVSLGLTYRYFSQKEALVLALYGQVAEEVAAHAAGVAGGTVAARFGAVVAFKQELLTPHKDAFGALAASALDPNSGASVLGGSAAAVRQRMRGVFRDVVTGATDAPSADLVEHVALVLYAAHLGLLLAWVHDASPDAARSSDLLDLAVLALSLGGPWLASPFAPVVLARVGVAVAPFFEASVAETSPSASPASPSSSSKQPRRIAKKGK